MVAARHFADAGFCVECLLQQDICGLIILIHIFFFFVCIGHAVSSCCDFEYYFSHKFYIFTITQVRLHFKHKIILYYSTYLPLKDGSAECRGVQQLCGASAMGLGAVTKTINRTAQIKLLGVTERSPLTFQIFLASASALERRKGLTRWMRIDIILRKETFR